MPSSSADQSAASEKVFAAKKITQLTEPIDLNRATTVELQRLPGIGPKLSERIVAERLNGPFRSVEDLRRVYGIGAKTIDRLRPHVTVEAGPTHRPAD
jgi:competence protein ComEA